MPSTQCDHRIFAPWLKFALLYGLGTGIFTALIVANVSLFTGIYGAYNGNTTLFTTLLAVFLQLLIDFSITAFCVGFFQGFFAGAIGGRFGVIWTALVFSALLPVLLQYSSHRLNGIYFGPQEQWWFAFASLGGFLPLYFMGERRLASEKLNVIREQLRGSWLIGPPCLTRLGGLLAPLALPWLVTIYFTLPIYLSNQRYVSRIGVWGTWTSSNRLALPGSRRNTCQSNLKQIMLGVKQYAQDYDDMYPPVPQTKADGPSQLMQPYLRSIQVFQCPNDFIFSSGADPSNGEFTDYWFNAHLYGKSETGLGNISSIIASGDGNTNNGEGSSDYSLSSIPKEFSPAVRHLAGANYAFGDGHVKWIRSGGVSNTLPSIGGKPTMVP